jgi:hypothetical protein
LIEIKLYVPTLKIFDFLMLSILFTPLIIKGLDDGLIYFNDNSYSVENSVYSFCYIFSGAATPVYKRISFKFLF